MKLIKAVTAALTLLQAVAGSVELLKIDGYGALGTEEF